MKRIINQECYRMRAACCFLFFILTIPAQSQRPFIQTSADRTNILIGEQIRLIVKATAPLNAGAIKWFWMPDSVRHFEMVERGRIDTVRSGNNTSFEQTLVITSFDSGRWYIPSFPVDIISGKGTITLFSDSIPVNVGYSPADSTGQLRDIKPVMEVSVVESYLYYIIAGIVLLIIIGILLYQYFKKRRSRPVPLFKSSLSPYDEAIQELQNLQKYDLAALPEVKEYHTKLADIFKRYYSRSQQKNLMNKTTGQILLYLKEHHVDAGIISVLADALRTSDAVKFAKYFPTVMDSRNALNEIKEATSSINKLQTKQ